MTSAIAATPIADTLSEALRAKPLRMLLLALLSVRAARP
jgi:hypothetical protein